MALSSPPVGLRSADDAASESKGAAGGSSATGAPMASRLLVVDCESGSRFAFAVSAARSTISSKPVNVDSSFKGPAAAFQNQQHPSISPVPTG